MFKSNTKIKKNQYLCHIHKKGLNISFLSAALLRSQAWPGLEHPFSLAAALSFLDSGQCCTGFVVELEVNIRGKLNEFLKAAHQLFSIPIAQDANFLG